ncbi:hypothetical protein BCR36DRAFT_410791 [Piromyces finnis]|uniref:Uncharacterized protein n=1 Tax=Piromyces finnis TaxID=1754191 RepID=A0A1Y1VEM9_9FUNG|nr:hypothetical protein BCR36DRAFT_410791 [Piromyces finnis]|eukprot:ORX54248.1 hypothetical protein BCR36DRAFT_410791 [Piromyces finnis]
MLKIFITEIIEKYGKDINILNYCLDIIKQYNLKIKSISGYRVPMNHSLEVLKYYSDKICIKNKLYFKCQDKTVENFLNICFSDFNLESFNFFSLCYNHQLSKRYNIDFCEIVSKIKIIKKEDNNTKDDNDNNDNNTDGVNDKDESYYRGYKILKDPNYILSLKLEFDNYTECFMIKLCYLASLIHNKYITCDLNNFGNEEYALLILAATNNKGEIAKLGNNYLK